MKLIKYPSEDKVNSILGSDEPLLVLISFDEDKVIISSIDDAVEHHILLKKVGFNENDIDKYFRIILDNEGADWTFVCPSNYKNINDKTKRISSFYKDGFTIISKIISNLGYYVGINIPKRYRRHFDIMSKNI